MSSAFRGAARPAAVLRHLLELAEARPGSDASQHELAEAMYGEVGDTPADRVRWAVNDTRHRLAQYYDAEGVGEPWRLRIPRGHYRLEIEPAIEPPVAPETPANEPAAEEAPELAGSAIRRRFRASRVGGAAAGGFLLLLALTVLVAMRRESSASARQGVADVQVQGGILRFLDAGGDEIARHDLGCETATGPLWRHSGVVIADLSADHVSDAAAANWCEGVPGSAVVTMADGATGIVSQVRLASGPDGAALHFAPDFQTIYLKAVADPGAEPRWLAVGLGHVAHGLGRLVMLDRDLEEVGSYWLWGHPTRGPVVADLDQDGRSELLVPYRDDHAGMAGLLVFDPSRVEGCMPHAEGFAPLPANGPPGSHLALHLFPPTALSVRALRQKTYVDRVTVLADGSVELRVTDGAAIECGACWLLWRLDPTGRLERVTSADALAQAWAREQRDGRLAGPDSEAMLASLPDRYRFHDGATWWPHSPCDDEPCGDH